MKKIRVSVEVSCGLDGTEFVTRRVRSLLMPTIQEARTVWDKIHGEVDWPEIDSIGPNSLGSEPDQELFPF